VAEVGEEVADEGDGPAVAGPFALGETRSWSFIREKVRDTGFEEAGVPDGPSLPGKPGLPFPRVAEHVLHAALALGQEEQ